MTKFILRRLLLLLFTMILVSMIVFAMVESSPGNVARNVLGSFVTPEQEASFLKQMGLDQPVAVRYVHWLLGSDLSAARKIGLPLKRIKSSEGYDVWYAADKDQRLVRWKVEGDDLFRMVRIGPGEELASVRNDLWRTDENRTRFFWGVNGNGQAVKWERGTDSKAWNFVAGSGWMETAGGPVEYIPLKKGFLRGDPGISLKTGRPVADSIFIRLRNSLVLAGIAFVIVMPLALLLGVLAGIKEGGKADRILSIAGMIFTVIPEFVTGIFLILIFSFWLKWVPGAAVFGEQAPWQRPDMLILPLLTLTLVEVGYVLRITRASMIEVLRSPYIRTAFLKGLSYPRIIFRHALKNGLMAPITVVMLHMNWLLGGIVVVEVVFGYPGLGQYLLESALYKDINALEAGAMILVLAAVGSQLIADIIYTLINPRIRYA